MNQTVPGLASLRFAGVNAVIVAALLVGCGALLGVGCTDDRPAPRPGNMQQGGTIIETPGREDNPSVLSPPILGKPLLHCGSAVKVKGFRPDAEIRIMKDGIDVIGTATGEEPEGQMVPVSPTLEAGWVITATQSWGGATSAESTERTVQTALEAYPDGMPQPDFPALPLYDCGRGTLVNHLMPGGEVDVFKNATDSIGHASGVDEHIGLGISPAFEEPDPITAQSSICSTPGPVSEVRRVEASPGVPPAPEPEDPYENGSRMVVGKLLNGAVVRIKDTAGDPRGGGIAPSGRVWFALDPPAGAGENFEVEQELCADAGPSPIGTATTRPCSDLPAPILVGPAPGDIRVYLHNTQPDAHILIYSGSEEIGDGGGYVVQLVRPVVAGETLIAIQELGGCRSSSAYQVEVGSGLEDPGDPGSSGYCEYGRLEYGANGEFTTDISAFFNSPAWCVPHSMNQAPLHGLARVPNGPGRFPVVMIVHGNHASREASEPGYDYLLDQLAKHCFIAISVDENFLNLCLDPWAQVSGEIDARGLILLRHLQLWRSWDRDPTHELFTRVDHQKVMLAGHSRGGEAIVTAAKLNQWLHDATDADFDFGFGIESLYAIAPVDGQLDTDTSVPLAGFPSTDPLVVNEADYFIIHGSHDGDLDDFQGHKTYDRAFPVTRDTDYFKGLAFVYGANHAQFNEVWVHSPDHSTDIPDGDLLAINRTHAVAFALATLNNWHPYRALFKGQVSFPSLPTTATWVSQYQDPERAFLNHYEEDDDPATGSRGGVTNTHHASLAPYEDRDFFNPGVNYWLWQETDGLVLGWSGATDRWLEVDLPAGLGALTDSYPWLGFRVGQVFDPDSSHNAAGSDKDLRVQLRFADGSTSSALRVSDYARLPYPIKPNDPFDGGTKTIMSSVRMPWGDFLGAGDERSLADLASVRFLFDRHASGLLVFDEIQMTQ